MTPGARPAWVKAYAVVLGTAWPALFGAAEASAQEVRMTGVTSFRYVEVRPFIQDSVLAGDAQGTGFYRQSPDGGVVRCVTGDPFCRGTRPGQVTSTVPIVQDLELNAWGFGEGVRLHAQGRGRTALGDSPGLWPQADERFDLLAAFAELDREAVRVRAGRQWTTSGLGFYNFDGLAVAVRPVTGLSVEGMVGRSLVRGLNEPRTGGALAAIDDLAPVEPGIMLSSEVRYRPSNRLSLAALYHRDIRRDRAGLYSELAGAHGVYRFGAASVEASLERNQATGQLNEGRLRVRTPPLGSTVVTGEVRRYRPYFELWTIWGAFSPVGFDQGRVDVAWTPGGRSMLLRGEASYRSYHDPGTDGSVGNFRTDGWGLGVDGTWFARPQWRAEGGYRLEVSFGSTRSEGYAGVRRLLGDRGQLSVNGLAFQRLYEFRLDEGVVVGLGGDASFRTWDRGRVTGGLSAYRHLDRGTQVQMDWTQLRGHLRMEWTIGTEPGRDSSGEAGP
jgi:hypothetical protein